MRKKYFFEKQENAILAKQAQNFKIMSYTWWTIYVELFHKDEAFMDLKQIFFEHCCITNEICDDMDVAMERSLFSAPTFLPNLASFCWPFQVTQITQWLYWTRLTHCPSFKILVVVDMVWCSLKHMILVRELSNTICC